MRRRSPPRAPPPRWRGIGSDQDLCSTPASEFLLDPPPQIERSFCGSVELWRVERGLSRQGSALRLLRSQPGIPSRRDENQQGGGTENNVIPHSRSRHSIGRKRAYHRRHDDRVPEHERLQEERAKDSRGESWFKLLHSWFRPLPWSTALLASIRGWHPCC